MRKLKALFAQVDVNGFSPLIACVVHEGVTTDVALLKADLKSLSQSTGIACQVLRALQQTVIRLTAATETELDNNTISKFSSGFSALDATLYGGFEFGLITEVCGGHEKSKFILCAIETFLSTLPNGEVHHIDTTGTFEPRQIGNQSQQMMTRIHCYEAFSISELHRLIEQIAALHTANKKPSLIVINGLANLVTAEWDAATKISDMLCAMESVRKLSLSILMLRTAGTADGWQSKDNVRWDSCVDLRVVVSREAPLRCQCDIVKARIPVAGTEVTLNEIL